MRRTKKQERESEYTILILLGLGCAAAIIYSNVILVIPLVGLTGAFLRYKELEIDEAKCTCVTCHLKG